MAFPPPTERQARIIWTALTGLAVGVVVGLVGLLLWGLGALIQQLSAVVLPLGVAGIIACLLDPVVDALETRGLSRARAIVCVFSLATVVVAALIGSVVPQIVQETGQLTERIPGYAVRLQERVRVWINNPPAPVRKLLSLAPHSEITTNAPASNSAISESNGTNEVTTVNSRPEGRALWANALDPKAIQSATGWLARALPRIGSWMVDQVTRVASWFGVLAGLVLIPVYAFYLLLEKRGIERNWTDYLPITRSYLRDELIFILGSINECLIAFFRGQVLVAICDGVLYTIGFLAVGLPYSFLLGAAATVLTMVPFLGAIIVCVTALIIASVQFGDWLHPALVMSVFGVVQLLEGLVISPRIMGNRVGLHPLTIIIAVMVGTALMGGILGGILAIPLTAALRAVMFRYVWKVREAKATPAGRGARREASGSTSQ
jgi:predicted PurR-regulated permease PerM